MIFHNTKISGVFEIHLERKSDGAGKNSKIMDSTPIWSNVVYRSTGTREPYAVCTIKQSLLWRPN
jgi:hypothetical protein